MKDLIKHKVEFDRIVKRYKLDNDQTAEEISNFLTTSKNRRIVSYEEFAKLFQITLIDAQTFLSFIHKGIQFKEISNKDL